VEAAAGRTLVREMTQWAGDSRRLLKERSAARLGQYDVTAAIDADEADPNPATDANRRERYATEATRVADRHNPGDTI